MAALLSALCAPCCACLRRQGFQKLVDLVECSERGEFDMDDTIWLHLPSASGAERKRGWLDLKIGIVRTPVFCIIQNGNFETYSTEVDKSDASSPDFQGAVDLCGALLFAARSASYIEIRNKDGSFYFKMKSSTQFESWRCAMKCEIEYCNWTTFVEHGGDMEAMPADLVAWFDLLIAAREQGVRELSEGAVMIKHFTALGFRRSHKRILKIACSDSTDGETTVVLNAAANPVCQEGMPDASSCSRRTLLPCEEDRVLWTSPSNEANIDAEIPESKGVSEILFSSIKALLNGTSESPVLRSLKYTEAQSQHCFSVVSSTDKMYDFEASSPEERDKWFRGLFIILKYNTLVTRALRHARAPVSQSRRASKEQLRKALSTNSS